jgi:serine/threonine-protein kinase RsbW
MLKQEFNNLFPEKGFINQKILSLEIKRESLIVLFDTIDKYIIDNKILTTSHYDLKLLAEETFINIVSYSRATEDIHILISHTEKEIILQFTDNGIAFDPFQATKENDVNEHEKISIGGLGIIMLQKLSNQIRYKRNDGKNQLGLIKIIS